MSTSLSGGGKTGASISVPVNTAVTDAATLSGTNAADSHGNGDLQRVLGLGLHRSGQQRDARDDHHRGYPAGIERGDPRRGTYYWQATYSGDTNNVASTSTCGSETETVTSVLTTPKATSLTTQLSGSGYFGGGKCSWLAAIISVFAGATVTDSATLGGANASEAAGTVTYTVYGHVASKSFPFWQWKPVASGGTVTVTGGKVPASKSVTLPAGIYEWQASYSGDTNNDPSMSKFGTRRRWCGPRAALQLRLELGTNGGCKPKPCPPKR